MSLCATGDLKLRRREDETILYLPALAAAQVVRDAAEYEPPPEPAMAQIDIPDYLSFGDRVEKENDSLCSCYRIFSPSPYIDYF